MGGGPPCHAPPSSSRTLGPPPVAPPSPALLPCPALAPCLVSDSRAPSPPPHRFNHLCPSVKKGDWTPDEDKIIQDGVAELGTKWSEIVKRLPGRTDNSIKNRYNSQLRREQRRARAAANGGGAKPAEPAPIAITAVESATATASSAADEEEPNAKRMRLETEATLAAAAAAVSAYTGSASTADAGSALPMPATDAALD